MSVRDYMSIISLVLVPAGTWHLAKSGLCPWCVAGLLISGTPFSPFPALTSTDHVIITFCRLSWGLSAVASAKQSAPPHTATTGQQHCLQQREGHDRQVKIPGAEKNP
jgi:hypothetical protein